jgi:5-methylcytosine-specific restriction endonuclease McrA
MSAANDKRHLVEIARDVAKVLKPCAKEYRLRVRLHASSSATETDGWRVTIGDLGKGRPTIQIWLDRFARQEDKTLSAWFEGNRKQIKGITQRVKKHLTPVRVVTTKDTEEGKYLRLSVPLKANEMELPIHEKHEDEETFFGIYGRAGISDADGVQRFVAKAADFFIAVASAQRKGKSKGNEDNRDIYPRKENRKVVALHVRRERSGWLATQCKERDNYTCTVCGFYFPDYYGSQGHAFAEAHHLVPLSKVKKCVMTKIDDLATVCANCHRMLHRMEGERTDVAKLRKIVKQLKSDVRRKAQ